MLSCPHCRETVVLRKLPHPSMFATFRLCPRCGKSFTVDAGTKRRQLRALLIAAASLFFTVSMYFQGVRWFPYAAASYVLLALIIWHGNSRVELVPYEGPERASDP